MSDKRITRKQFDEAMSNLFIGCKECKETECVHLQTAVAFADQQDKRIQYLEDDNVVLKALADHGNKVHTAHQSRMSHEVAEKLKTKLMEYAKDRITTPLGGDLHVNMADAMRIIDSFTEE